MGCGSQIYIFRIPLLTTTAHITSANVPLVTTLPLWTIPCCGYTSSFSVVPECKALLIGRPLAASQTFALIELPTDDTATPAEYSKLAGMRSAVDPGNFRAISFDRWSDDTFACSLHTLRSNEPAERFAESLSTSRDIDCRDMKQVHSALFDEESGRVVFLGMNHDHIICDFAPPITSNLL